ncbi:hypothetical protein SELMODRAFT_417186 [Selaginella moellendorffii]|uniref:Pentacotripeptide-repeat region of PRORP domain-containing protein n=1 Tax=Selaginella moellendorffii TaxID=88036 RepID=D8S1N3_SELML|nr:hypothetical protein SELMODRAFT_417186 [Selaginella moellendorffii]
MLEEFVHSEFTYGTLVHGHCLAGEFTRQSGLWRSLRVSPEAGLVDEAKRWVASPTASPTLIDALCSSGRIQEAREELQAMAKRGVAPYRVTYNAMATGLGKAGLLEEAFELMRALFLCKCGRPDEACKVMETMLLRNIEPNILTLNLILHAFCKAARPEEALGIGDGILPNHRHLQRAAGAVLQHRSDGQRRQAPGNVGAQQVQAKLRDLTASWSRSLRGWGDWENGGSSSVPGAAGDSHGDGGGGVPSKHCDLQQPCGGVLQARQDGQGGEMIAEGSLPDSTTYSVLIQGLCSAGQIEHAFMVMLQVTQAVGRIQPLSS